MNSSDNSKTVPYRPKRAALNWVDYLVIAATVLTFVAVIAANNPHAARKPRRRRHPRASVQTSQLGGDVGLIKARIGGTGRPSL